MHKRDDVTPVYATGTTGCGDCWVVRDTTRHALRESCLEPSVVQPEPMPASAEPRRPYLLVVLSPRGRLVGKTKLLKEGF